MANANQLKFDVRLDSKEGKDIHREFKGNVSLHCVLFAQEITVAHYIEM